MSYDTIPKCHFNISCFFRTSLLVDAKEPSTFTFTNPLQAHACTSLPPIDAGQLGGDQVLDWSPLDRRHCAAFVATGAVIARRHLCLCLPRRVPPWTSPQTSPSTSPSASPSTNTASCAGREEREGPIRKVTAPVLEFCLEFCLNRTEAPEQRCEPGAQAVPTPPPVPGGKRERDRSAR